MLLSQYTTTFFLLILIDLTSQLYLIPYWIVLYEGNSLFEYNDRQYKTMSDMISVILLDRKIKKPEDAYLYNVGFKKGTIVTKTDVKTCECITSFLYPGIKSATCDVRHRNPSRNIYKCNKQSFNNFDDALEQSLRHNCHIKFYPPHCKPSIPPKNICITTLFGVKCLMRNPATQSIWKRVWSTCNGNCFFNSGFAHTRNHYLKELNQYRGLVGSPPLTMNPKLNVMAKSCAEKLAYRNKLISEKKGDYDEFIAFAKEGYGLYLIRILFDDYYFSKSNFGPGSIKYKNDFTRLLRQKQRIVGFGMSRNGYGTYICIRSTSDYW
uniref:SCP domain-containing protein n=1 Tax=Strongyloides papillosus TaxID=174720 RepID=A0A0N5CBX6_STREA